MKLRFLVKWYDTILEWSKHPKAVWYMGLLSFIDASLFPISPLAMLLPMSYAAPAKAFTFAFVAIVGSFFGGMVGYAIGYFAFEAIVSPFLQWMGYMSYYEAAMRWFQSWGEWTIIIGCFTPFIPYKFFTIGAGVLQYDFFMFLLSSLLGRSGRFMVIALIIQWGGPKIEPILKRTLVRISR